jgi:hypothetical protein
MTSRNGHDRPTPQDGRGTTIPDPSGMAELEAAFAALRARAADPDPARQARLLARVMEDAAAQPVTVATPPRRAWHLPPRIAQARLPVGLAAALTLGLWIGLAAPAPVLQLEEALFGPQPLAGLVEPGELFAE